MITSIILVGHGFLCSLVSLTLSSGVGVVGVLMGRPVDSFRNNFKV